MRNEPTTESTEEPEQFESAVAAIAETVRAIDSIYERWPEDEHIDTLVNTLLWILWFLVDGGMPPEKGVRRVLGEGPSSEELANAWTNLLNKHAGEG